MLKPKALKEVLAQMTNGGIQSTVYVALVDKVFLFKKVFLSKTKDY